MIERKNIDKLFQEQFKDFEVDPPENTWPELERRLKEKKDRKILPFWWRLAGVAAALLIGFAIADNFGLFGLGEGIKNEVVIENNNGDSENSNPQNGVANDQKSREVIVETDADSADTDKNPVTEITNQVVKANGSLNTENNSENGDKRTIKRVPENNTVANSTDNEKSKEKKIVKKSNHTNNSSGIATGIATSNDGHQNQNAERFTGTKSSVATAGRTKKVKKSKSDLHPETNGVTKNHDDAIAESLGNKQQKSVTGKFKNTILQPDINNDAMANQDKNDVKSSDTAPNNQKTELNLNATTNTINPVAVAEDAHPKKLDSTATAMTVPNALEELLKEKENKRTKEPKLNRWQITSNVAPIYFGSTSGGSPIDSTFANNSKEYNTQVSYGLGVQYAVNNKLTIRTGVNKVSLSYDTNDVLLYAGLNEGGLDNVDMPTQNGTLNFARSATSRSNLAGRSDATEAVADLSTDKFAGSINQKMGYIEVPLELSYAVIDKKLGVNIIAGVSTLFLNDNKIMLTSEGLSTNLGEANNLNKTHFSSNVGLGLRYRFLQSFEANFEPIFKYQLNTFSKDSGDFKPYFFGLYTGVSFRF